jgi:hypothetical protein
VLFGGEIDVELWSIRIRRDIAISERWQWKEPEDSGEKSDEPAPAPTGIPKELKNMMLPVAVRRDESTDLFDHRSKIRDGDVMTWLVLAEREESAHEWLRANGWIPAPTVELKGDSDGAGA